MWSGRGRGLGVYVAHEMQERQERVRRETATKIRELNLEIAEQQQKINDWLEKEENQNFFYHAQVSDARAMLAAQVTTPWSNPSLNDVQNKLDDLKALNIALETKDVTDLLERAKVHMEYASPFAIALGVTLAVIGLGILVAATCPALILVGLSVFLGGCIAAIIGAEKTPTERTFTLFNAANAIDTDIGEEDLHGADYRQSLKIAAGLLGPH